MTKKRIACPCCDFPKVEETVCPNCNADLTVMRRLDEFPGHCLETGQALLEQNPDDALALLGTALSLDPQLEEGHADMTRLQTGLRTQVTREILAAQPKRNPNLRLLAGLVAGVALTVAVNWSLPNPESRPVPAAKQTAPVKPAPAAPVPPEPVNYRVREGDSFWRIAQRQYGTALVWTEIEKENQEQVARRGGLFPGDEIRLPALTFRPVGRARP